MNAAYATISPPPLLNAQLAIIEFALLALTQYFLHLLLNSAVLTKSALEIVAQWSKGKQ